jgi:transcriptional regulator with XRE-family HTH domain
MTDDPAQESVGERVKRLRSQRVLSQRELAELSSVPLPTLKDIERGATTQPRPQTLRALAQALGVSPTFLLHGKEDS